MFRLRSFRLRITVWFVGLFSVLFIAFGVFSYRILARDLQDRVDQSLSQAAATTSVMFLDELEESNGDPVKAAVEVVSEVHTGAGLIAIFKGPNLLASNGPLSVAERAALVPPLPFGEEIRFAPHAGRYGARIAAHTVTGRGTPYLIAAIEPLDAVAADLAVVRGVLITALPLLIAMAGVGGYLVARRNLAPLSSMAEQASLITGQNLDARLAIGPASEELTVVADSFNELLSRVHDSFQTMRRFVSDASHELRTPLAVIRGEADVALNRERSGAEYREALGVIQDEARRLTSLVEALLNMARADAGQSALLLRDFYLNELAADCCAAVQQSATARHIHLECRADRDVQFQGDEELLRHLISNLLDNALRYTPEGGSVTAEVDAEHGQVCIRVSDTGIGIAPEAAAHVFERFYRVDKARTRHGGFGLGLAIVKWIAEAHGGAVTLVSEPGLGSRFTVMLPDRGWAGGLSETAGRSDCAPEGEQRTERPATRIGNAKPVGLADS